MPVAQLDTFLNLRAEEDADAKIAEKRRDVEGLRHIDSLREQNGPEKVELPPLPTKLGDILANFERRIG